MTVAKDKFAPNNGENIEAPPKAAILIESMRDIGYSLETALADVIDNSITAGARNILIKVDTTAGAPIIGIIDDGSGMSREELVEAMRLGSRNPLDKRGKRDLGRFGLGLKTASFSQCRRLSVVARRRGELTAAVWDLDHVAASESWSLQIPHDPLSIPFAAELTGDGALVVWEKLDRSTESIGSDAGRKHFINRLDEASRHLELVFHRYLMGEPGIPRVKMEMNGLGLTPHDPFHASHPATMRGVAEQIHVKGLTVEITPFTLPHHRNVTASEWERFEGNGGYLKNQGFYLYREKRLIVHGTWFGLARQTELTKLARVRIDMPNGLDPDWHIDVKKAWARPPLAVRERLQRIVREMGAPSRTIFTRRGSIPQDTTVPVWQRSQENNQIVYHLNASNAILKKFIVGLNASQQAHFDELRRTIAAALPMDAIFADLAGSPDQVKADSISHESLARAVEVTVASLQERRIKPEIIHAMLRVAEPFRSNWDRAEGMVNKRCGGTDDDE